MFELATTLAHHMYSHNVSKHHCDKCDFHCFFKSELESHKVVHREQPSHKCMYPKCGCWFKRKGELSLHVETHKKTWYDCKKCDFSTKLLKYLKEHEKSHIKKNEDLLYACDICGKTFPLAFRSQTTQGKNALQLILDCFDRRRQVPQRVIHKMSYP